MVYNIHIYEMCSIKIIATKKYPKNYEIKY